MADIGEMVRRLLMAGGQSVYDAANDPVGSFAGGVGKISTALGADPAWSGRLERDIHHGITSLGPAGAEFDALLNLPMYGAAALGLGAARGARAPRRLVVARKLPDGTVQYGKPGQIHGELVMGEDLSKLPEDYSFSEGFGFSPHVGGPFLTREEARAYVGAPPQQWGGLDALELDEAGALPRGAPGEPVGKSMTLDEILAARTKPDAPFPQYANEYPPVGPPQLMDKATEQPILGLTQKQAEKLVAGKKAYWSKQLTPEAQAFAKERERVHVEMKDEDRFRIDDRPTWPRFFDPAQRYDANKANYPTDYTPAQAAPKMEKTRTAQMEKYNTPENRARLKEAYFKGLDLPDTTDWYMLGQMEDFAIENLGREKGIAAMKDFAGRMAATTGGAKPQDNMLMAHYVGVMGDRGVQLPATHQLPYPIGGRFAKGNLEQANKYLAGEQFGAANPKRADFQYSFLGHRDRPVMDEQMMKGFDPTGKIKKPPGESYHAHSQATQDVAADVGVDPQRVQEVAWHGFKGEGGEPFIETMNRAIERTHRLTGIPRREAALRFLTKAGPIYGLAAPLLYANWSDQSPE